MRHRLMPAKRPTFCTCVLSPFKSQLVDECVCLLWGHTATDMDSGGLFAIIQAVVASKARKDQEFTSKVESHCSKRRRNLLGNRFQNLLPGASQLLCVCHKPVTAVQKERKRVMRVQRKGIRREHVFKGQSQIRKVLIEAQGGSEHRQNYSCF